MLVDLRRQPGHTVPTSCPNGWIDKYIGASDHYPKAFFSRSLMGSGGLTKFFPLKKFFGLGPLLSCYGVMKGLSQSGPFFLRLLRVAVATNCLCCMVDGMDQAKFKLPRMRSEDNLSNAKAFASLFRPRLHVAGTWVHGRRLTLWVSDEDVCKNSTTQMEMIARSLSAVHNEHGLPYGFCCQQDNTYREGKNRFFLAFCILTVAIRTFRWCIVSYLRVGHSFSAAPLSIFQFVDVSLL